MPQAARPRYPAVPARPGIVVDTAGPRRQNLAIVGNGADDSGDEGEPKASSGRPNRRITDRLRPGPDPVDPDGLPRPPLPPSQYAPPTLPPPSTGSTGAPPSSRRAGPRRRDPLSIPPPPSTRSPESWRPGGVPPSVRGARKSASDPLTIPPPSTGAPPSSRRAGSVGADSNHRGLRTEPLTLPPPSTGSPPSSRHVGGVGGAGAAGPRKLSVEPPPPSAPPEGEGLAALGAAANLPGRVHRLVAWCDAHKGSFFISLLILQTGIKLRELEAGARDDRAVMAKLWPALDVLLTSAEIDELRRVIRDPW